MISLKFINIIYLQGWFLREKRRLVRCTVNQWDWSDIRQHLEKPEPRIKVKSDNLMRSDIYIL